MSQDFSMQNDDYFITFIAERVYRGTCLVFWITGFDSPVQGWITGIDDDFIQLCSRTGQKIILISRQHIISVMEVLEDGKPYKINDIKDGVVKENVLSYTKKLREKAELFKKR